MRGGFVERFIHQVLPVIISVIVIIVVAILRSTSRPLAAILSTMPLTIPLSLWVVYAGVGGDRRAMTEFARALSLAILPTVAFTFAVWQAARAGWRLVPMLLAGYAVWGIGLGVMWLIRRLLTGA
jgi:hypothetical protein